MALRAEDVPARDEGDERRAVLAGAEHDLLLLQGVEPSLHWRAFCQTVIDMARELGAGMVITLGALLADDLFKASVKVKVPTRARTDNEAPDRLLADLEASWESSEPQTFVLAG